MERSDLAEVLKTHGQDHVLQWFEQLSAPARSALTGELAALDPRTLALLGDKLRAPAPVRIEHLEPAPVIPLPRSDAERQAEAPLVEKGNRAIAAGELALLTVAGGQGTRLGYDGPKGTLPITPVTGKSLFQHHAEKILASRRRWRAALPWFIMTSPDNDGPTREFFREHGFFGLGEESVYFFVQGTLPILDTEGRLLLKAEDALLTGPDGHGGVIEALEQSGMLAEMERRGCRCISYFQIDNPLVHVVDPRYVGCHVSHGSEFSSKVIARRDQNEGLGLAVIADGQTKVLEYVDIRNDLALQQQTSRTDEQGHLAFSFGSIAIHLIDVALVRRLATAASRLPLHPSAKKYEAFREPAERGRSLEKRDCFKFERFVFDAIEQTSRAIFVETDRQDEFAPVKRAGSADEEDTPDRARRMMMALWGRWLQACGVEVFDRSGPESALTCQIEISPLFALDLGGLSDKLSKGTAFRDAEGRIVLL